MKLRLWMMNDRMWASGMRANKWKPPTSWGYFGWFTTRDPHKWTEEQLTYFDYCFALMMQADSGWN